MSWEYACDAGYLPAPSLNMLNTELVEGIKSWKKLGTCPACTERSLTPFATIRKMPYSRCRACGFSFANPVPPSEVISAFYNSSFYSNYRRLEQNRIMLDKYFSVSIGVDTMQHLGTWLGDDKTVKVLDYGCGPGTFLAILRDQFGFSHLEGIELNKESLEVAKHSYALNLHASHEELSHSSYDYVVLLEVIEHLPEPDTWLSQVATLLRPGGGVY